MNYMFIIRGEIMKIYLVRHGQTNSNLNGVFNTLDEDIKEKITFIKIIHKER